VKHDIIPPHCKGCGLTINDEELMFDWGSIDLHDNKECVYEYVKNDATRKICTNKNHAS
jgi:hypothetical protein